MTLGASLKSTESAPQPLDDHAPAAHFVVGVDGRIERSSEHVLQLLGYAAAELEGRPLVDLCAATEQARTEAARILRRCLLEERVRAEQLEMRHKTGRSVFVRLSADRTYDPGGELRCIHCVAVDITDLATTIRALRESEIQRTTILGAILEPLVCIDDMGVIQYTSDSVQRVFGYEPSELDGRNVSVLMGEAHRSDHDSYLSRYRRTRQTNILGGPREFEAQRKDGSLFPCEISVARYDSGDGHSDRFVGIIRDLTAKKEEEARQRQIVAQIQQAQKLESLGVLAGGIAHDFNNLLMGILGNAAVALMDLPRESPMRELLLDIQSSGKYAAELTRQMLAYAGSGQAVWQNFALRALVEEMGHLLSVSISSKCVVAYDFSHDGPVCGDISQIRQVVMNLIINASEAIGDRSGVVSVRVGIVEADRQYFESFVLDEELPEGTYSYLEVSDTGSGMDAETLAKIFDPFFTTKFSGRGLGLAALLGIVRNHHGAIKVYSELGRGTTFKVLLPAADSSAVSSVEPTDWKKVERSGVILVIDDEETPRSVAKRILSRVGFDVLLADGGRAGIELFSERRDDIALVIVDYTMPHMTGKDVLRELVAVDPDVKVIVASGHLEEEIMRRLGGRPVQAIIQKPYLPEVMLVAIDRALAQ